MECIGASLRSDGCLGPAEWTGTGHFYGCISGAVLVRTAGRVSAVDAFDHRGDPLADADAHRREAVAAAGALQLMAQHRDQPGAAHPERVAERDRAAVHVDLVGVQAELVDAD